MIPLKDSLTSGPLPRVTIVLIVLNLLVLGWQVTLSDSDSTSPELAAEHVSKRDQAAIELGAIPFRLTHPGSECGIGSEGIVCGEHGLVEAGGTVGTTIPDDIAQAPWWVTPLTSTFLHADLLHVVDQHAVPVDLRRRRRGPAGPRGASSPSTCRPDTSPPTRNRSSTRPRPGR